MKQIFRTLIIVTSTAIAMTGCAGFPYQAPVQQGNKIETGRVGLIREGMTRNDIANTVGSPVMTHLFHANRWDYIYTLDNLYGKVEKRRITIWFTNDIATKVERDLPVEAAGK